MTRISRIFLISCLVSLFLVPVPDPAYADQQAKEVTALGVADGKSARARDEALNDALRQAVEQGVGTFVTAELTVEQQRLVEERIYTDSGGYIQSYDILRQGVQEDLYEVEIKARVKMGKLENDLISIGLIIRKKRNPRVMVVIYSSEVDSSFMGVALEGNRNAENQLERTLIEKGFQLVDAGQVSRKKELESLLLGGDPKRAAMIAKELGAEILVQGEVRRSFVNKRTIFGRPTRFFTNEIRLKAFEADTAKILFSDFRTRPASGAEAVLPLEDATSELADEMVAGILEQWRQDIFNASSYQLKIEKASFSDLNLFKKGLIKIRGLNDAQVRSFHSGHALMEVKYEGPLEELAEKIAAMKAPAFEILGLQANILEIKFAN